MDYLKINQQLWNEKTKYHLKSDFYDVDSFLKGKTSLKSIESNLLNEVKGKTILHLQCHFGQDSISLARLGAEVTGIDLSDESIAAAQNLANLTNVSCEFIHTDVYSLSEKLTKKFDVVFTTYGVIGWLPDLDRWAEIIRRFLNPGGKLVFVEFHPFIWMYNYDLTEIEFSYFNRGMIVEETDGTYAAKKAPIKKKSVGWNHPISEVFSALTKQNLKISFFEEYDYSPYNSFNNMVETEKDRFQFKGLEGKLPITYALKATL